MFIVTVAFLMSVSFTGNMSLLTLAVMTLAVAPLHNARSSRAVSPSVASAVALEHKTPVLTSDFKLEEEDLYRCLAAYHQNQPSRTILICFTAPCCKICCLSIKRHLYEVLYLSSLVSI